MENKTGKYIKYAIGEIILVVIGILIALSINNWNESNIKSKQEQKLLLQLTSDLNKNKQEVAGLKERLIINKFSMDSLLVYLDSGEYNKMVPFYAAFIQRKSFFNNASSSFNMLKNGMASNITNDTILKDILNLYENDFNNLKTREQEMHSQIDDIQKAFVNKLFKPMKNPTKFKFDGFDEVQTDIFEPLNFDALSKNYEYINSLYQLKKSSETRLAFIEKTAINIDSTLSRLDKELKKNN